MRVVAAGKHLLGAGERDRQFQSADIEVDGIEVELAQVRAWRAIDMRAAIAEGVETAVEPLGQVGNRPTEVAERPFDARERLRNTRKDERRGGERCVEQKADERHQPVLLHRFDADRVGGMNIEDRVEIVRRFVDRPELAMAQRLAVDVAEEHRAAHAELAAGALELARRRFRVVERQRRQRGEVAPSRLHGFAEFVVDKRGELRGALRRLDLRTRRGQRGDLHGDAVLVEHIGAIREIAVAAHGDVVVAGVMDHRIAVRIGRHPHAAAARSQGVEILRWVVVVVEINYRHLTDSGSVTIGVGVNSDPGPTLTPS